MSVEEYIYSEFKAYIADNRGKDTVSIASIKRSAEIKHLSYNLYYISMMAKGKRYSLKVEVPPELL